MAPQPGQYILNLQTDYQTTGNGVSDDSPQIQNAYNDAANIQGATVFWPAGVYLQHKPIYIVGNVTTLGAGMDVTTLLAGPGLNDYQIIYLPTSIPITFVIGARYASGRMALQLAKVRSGQGRMNVASRAQGLITRMSDITLDHECASQSAGGCLWAAGATNCTFDHVRFSQPYEAGLWLDAISSGYNGGHNTINDCLFDLGSLSVGNGQGIKITNNIRNAITSCNFNANGGAGSSNWHIQDSAGNNFFTNCNFESGGDGIHVVTGADQDRITACNFTNLGGNAIYMGGMHSGITNNSFKDGCTLAPGIYSHVVLANNFNAVSDNTFWSQARNFQVRSFVREMSGVISSIIGPNHTFVGTSTGLLSVGMIEFAGGVATRIFGNPGWNPQGANVTQPAVPASGTQQLNNVGHDCMVVVVGGTVTIINVDGVATGLTSGAFRVPVGGTISITYTVAPTWKWFGD